MITYLSPSRCYNAIKESPNHYGACSDKQGTPLKVKTMKSYTQIKIRRNSYCGGLKLGCE